MEVTKCKNELWHLVLFRTFLPPTLIFQRFLNLGHFLIRSSDRDKIEEMLDDIILQHDNQPIRIQDLNCLLSGPELPWSPLQRKHIQTDYCFQELNKGSANVPGLISFKDHGPWIPQLSRLKLSIHISLLYIWHWMTSLQIFVEPPEQHFPQSGLPSEVFIIGLFKFKNRLLR